MTAEFIPQGTVLLSDTIHSQLGVVRALPGSKAISVFLGTVPDGEDPEPARRMEALGWRQMMMFECCVSITTTDPEWHAGRTNEHRVIYACLGAIDAVEAAIRFSKNMLEKEFNLQEPGTAPATIVGLSVSVWQAGPIADDGTPFDGRRPAFFGWVPGTVSLEDHLTAMRIEAGELAQ